MSIATMTSKGQTTIPKDIREGLGLQPKDQINFTLLPDGTVILRAKKRSIAELRGILSAPEGVSVSVEEMHAWRK
ncbi:MAG: type II toxin-antitoxin system PrlF family antitoxin [Sulfuricella sp.]|nr:type II toxin-antitoxin system PrlF family antitoxin [Sulfuricella sp.]